MKRKAWYLKKAPKRRNRVWTQADRAGILKQRMRNVSTAEIAAEWKVKKTTIYNQIRLARREMENTCIDCGRPLKPGEKKIRRTGQILFRCNKCRKENAAYKKMLRDTRIALGMCSTCGKRKALDHSVNCVKCISRTARMRLAQGLCAICGVNPVDPQKESLCAGCKAIYKHKRNQRKILGASRA